MSVQELGEAVRGRRLDLGMTQLDMSNNGGPSHLTVLNIENGKDGNYRPSTLRKLDTVLDWPSGSAERLFKDGTAPSETPAEMSDEDARALRIGRLMLALAEELRLA